MHVPEDDAALYKTIIFVVVVVVVVQFLFTGIESAYTMHTRRGCAPPTLIYQAVLFSSTSLNAIFYLQDSTTIAQQIPTKQCVQCCSSFFQIEW
jgi:hypothetical protein